LERLGIGYRGTRRSAEADIQPKQGARGKSAVVVDARRAALVAIVHLRSRRDVLVIGPQRETGARTQLFARLERHAADEGEAVERLGKSRAGWAESQRR